MQAIPASQSQKVSNYTMRVLLVEDEVATGEAIQAVLISEKYVVDWVQDGCSAWDYLEQEWTEYSVAIFDWMLPGLSGIELCQRLRSQGKPLPVLMLTALGEAENRVAGLDAGADDYLVKPFIMAELLARLRALQRRSPQFQAQRLQLGPFTLDDASNSLQIAPDVTNPAVPNPTQTIPLTVKEFQILAYLMRHPQQIIPSSKIRHQLWDFNDEPVSNVVAAQIRLLRRKFEKYGCDCPIVTVPGQGYRFTLPQPDSPR